MSFDSIFFLFKTAVSNFFKNIVLSIASISVLSVCLVIFGASLILIENVNIVIRNLGAKTQVVIYLDETLTDDEISTYRASLLTIGNIKTADYKSKEQAMEEYKASFGEEYADITADLDASILRNSFTVSMKDPEKYDQTIYEIGKLRGAANIVEKRDVIERISYIRDVISFLCAGIMVFLFAISVFIIISTVKTAVYARREEISIMKYCGATDLYIKFPYFIEGLMIGVLSGILGYFVLKMIYGYILYPIFIDFGFFTPQSFTDAFTYIIWVFVGVGALIGSFSSVLPVRKYLDV